MYKYIYALTMEKRRQTLMQIELLRKTIFPSILRATKMYVQQQQHIEFYCSFHKKTQFKNCVKYYLHRVVALCTPEILSLIATIAKLRSIRYPFTQTDTGLVESFHSPLDESDEIDAQYSGSPPYAKDDDKYIDWWSEKKAQLSQRDARWEKKIRTIESDCFEFHTILTRLHLIINTNTSIATSYGLFTIDPVSLSNLDDLIISNKKDQSAVSDLIAKISSATVDYSPFTKRWFHVTLM